MKGPPSSSSLSLVPAPFGPSLTCQTCKRERREGGEAVTKWGRQACVRAYYVSHLTDQIDAPSFLLSLLLLSLFFPPDVFLTQRASPLLSVLFFAGG